MAVIGKIQKNSVLLLVVIGLAMLAFIFTEYFKANNDNVEQVPTGSIYGEPLDEIAYNDLLKKTQERDEMNARYQQKDYTEQDKRASEDRTFNETVRKFLMNAELGKLGIETTSEELSDMILGNHIHEYVKQIPNFQGPTGYSRDSARQFISQLQFEPQTTDQNQYQQWLTMHQQWKDFENELKDVRAVNKYITLIKRGLYANNLESELEHKAQNEKKKVKFVLQRYGTIPQDEVEVTDEDLLAYYNEHKNEKTYEQTESRDLEFIQFEVKPSEDDLTAILAEVEGLKEQFKTAPSNIGFMMTHSELKTQGKVFTNDSAEFKLGTDKFTYESSPYGGGNLQYPASIDEQIQAADSGDVIGPVLSGNEVVLAKFLGGKKEKRAWVRHILVGTSNGRTMDAAKVRADSIIAVIKEHNNFVEMVALTDDPGSIANNGEYKWFPEGQMVPEFNDASFNGKFGELQLVKTQYGYHIVEVLGRGDRVVPKLAIVGKMAKPGDNTIRAKEREMFDHIYAIKGMKEDSAFNKYAQENGFDLLSSRVYLNSGNVNGFKEAKNILRFAFSRTTKEGDLSSPILDDYKFTIAKVTNIIDEGVPDFEDIKDRIQFPAKQEKQAQAYIEKMKAAGNDNLEQPLSVVENGTIQEAEITFGSTTIQGGGSNEGEVIGKLFSNVPDGSITAPIKGKAGIYVFQVLSSTPAPETSDYSTIKEDLNKKRQDRADNAVITALREKADVKDNRRKKEYQ